MRRFVVGLLVFVLVLGALAAVAFAVFVAPTHVFGTEMWPSVGDGSWLLVRRRATPARGDIILFEGMGGRPTVRRVLAIPGDQVGFAGGKLVVAGHPAHDETVRTVEVEGRKLAVVRETVDGKSYDTLVDAAEPAPKDAAPAPIAGYWVAGDNREHASDSRELGVVPRGKIDGVVISVVSQGRRP